MALKKSGVLLVAEGYNSYRQQMRELNKLHKQAFDQSAVKGYSRSSREFVTSSQRMKASAKSTWDVVSNLRNAFNQASDGANKTRGFFASLSDILNNLKSAFSGASGGAGIFSGGLIGLIGSLTKVGLAIKTAMKIVDFVKASGDVAQSAETMKVSLEEVGTAVGYSNQQITLAVNLLKNQGITTTVAQKSLLRMARANISWAEASKLAQIAQGSAVIAGMNSSEAFERLVTGIQKMEPELLDELGITLQREQAYKKFADQMDLNAQTLTQAQKQQAILNSIYEQSEVVIGVYDAAMETTGKQQASLARHIEETQLSVGKLILPFKAASVEMKTNFWKGLRTVAKGLESWAPLIEAAIKGVKSMAGALLGITPIFKLLEKATSGTGGVFETMGRGAHAWAKITVESAVFVAAGIEKALNIVKGMGKQITEMWSAIEAGDASAFWDAFTKDIDIGPSFKKSFDEIHKEAEAMFPEVFKSWEELNQEIEGTSEDLRLPGEEGAEEAADNVDELKESLENLISVYQRLDDINRKFNEDVAKLQADQVKEVAKANEDLAKSIEKAEEKKAEALKKLETDTAKERAKTIDDFNRRRVQEEKKRNRELEFEQKRFQLSMLQAQRRFQLDDKRLRAEGDILGLMDLRENFELEQQEAKENFSLSQEEAKAQAQEEEKQREEELEQRLAELDEKAEEERKRINEAAQQEIEDLKAQNAIKMEEIAKNFEERFNQLVEGRNKELEELGRSLQDEGKITEEGMQDIAGHIGDVFGPGGASDSFIKGWASRTESEFGQLIQELKKELRELEDAAEDAAQAANQASSSTGTTDQFGFSPGRSGGRGGPRRIGMRHGGSGVVQGPAHFFVEPGVKEHVAFTPLPSGGGGNIRHSGNLNMGLDVSGLPSGLNEQLTEAIINKAANLTIDEIVIAVERAKRRAG